MGIITGDPNDARDYSIPSKAVMVSKEYKHPTLVEELIPLPLNGIELGKFVKIRAALSFKTKS